MKDYYKILNVSKTATDDEIKRSYRVLAKKYHPDVNPGNQKAADTFADINEAYDVISDSAKRAEYDRKVAEANAPRPSPEDIMARQRAAAQAAARQAAARQAAARQDEAARQAAMREKIRESMRRGETPLSMAQRVAAAQAAAAQAAAAQAQAQAQAQVNAIEKKAYDAGYARGKHDAKAETDREISSLKSDARALNAKISILEKNLAEAERDRSELEQELFNRDREMNTTKSDRSELEQELFNRDRELTQAKARADDLERQVELLRKRSRNAAFQASEHESGEIQQLKNTVEEYKERCRQLEQERNQAELKSQAQLELQQDKRRQLQDQIDDLMRQLNELTAENEDLRAENEQWQQYAKSEDFISDAERRMQEWENKQKVDKKLAKPTHYGTLGVLIWATDEEIQESYNKLVKRYGGKDDELNVEKVAKIEEAYAVLSDPEKRRAYNESIGITEERIADERRMIEEFVKLEEEYHTRLDDKEFWAHFDELTFNAQTGDAEAQNELAQMYYYGDEIDRDLEQAAYWFKEAAKQKHADAMYHLGLCFINGEGVERNETTGMGFIRQAAKLGSKEAMTFKGF
ncbi:MAG: DnaJ domain-containing protein [Clostridiales bacterium]|nr:DnaJ domain-containing protein [Clostridiales bacterium]